MSLTPSPRVLGLAGYRDGRQFWDEHYELIDGAIRALRPLVAAYCQVVECEPVRLSHDGVSVLFVHPSGHVGRLDPAVLIAPQQEMIAVVMLVMRELDEAFIYFGDPRVRARNFAGFE
jgi:hypothetical protein